MDKKIILARIDELMKENGVTNYQLKENVDISTTIYQWRKNAARDRERTPSLKSIEKICNYFEISLAYFFAFDLDDRSDIENKELYKAISEMSNEQKKILKLLIKQFK